jgi:hypothetical protein
MLQMSYFDREREPVVMDLGPVLDPADVIGRPLRFRTAGRGQAAGAVRSLATMTAWSGSAFGVDAVKGRDLDVAVALGAAEDDLPQRYVVPVAGFP